MAKIPEAQETISIRNDGKPDPKTGELIGAWEPGEAVVVRTYLSSGARRRIKDATMQFAEDPRTGKASIVLMNTAGATLEKLKAGIVSWTLVYASGRPVPCTETAMENLPDEYADFILDKLTELWSAWGRPSESKPQTEEAAQEAQQTF